MAHLLRQHQLRLLDDILKEANRQTTSDARYQRAQSSEVRLRSRVAIQHRMTMLSTRTITQGSPRR